jgi:hypothetical protein
MSEKFSGESMEVGAFVGLFLSSLFSPTFFFLGINHG